MSATQKERSNLTVWMCRLILVFDGCKCFKHHFCIVVDMIVNPRQQLVHYINSCGSLYIRNMVLIMCYNIYVFLASLSRARLFKANQTLHLQNVFYTNTLLPCTENVKNFCSGKAPLIFLSKNISILCFIRKNHWLRIWLS